MVTHMGGDETTSAAFGDEPCPRPGRLDAFVQGAFAKARTWEDYEDFFVDVPLPHSALRAITVAMETGVPQN